eukprot:2515088-Prymnesium_polylepis.1
MSEARCLQSLLGLGLRNRKCLRAAAAEDLLPLACCALCSSTPRARASELSPPLAPQQLHHSERGATGESKGACAGQGMHDTGCAALTNKPRSGT